MSLLYMYLFTNKRDLLEFFNELEVCHYWKLAAHNINIISPAVTSTEKLGQTGQVALQQGGVLPDQRDGHRGQEDARLTLRVGRVVAVHQLPDDPDKLNTGFRVQLDAVRIPRPVNG